MSTQDCLQQLCDETPEFSLCYQAFLEFYTRPVDDCRIVICGLANAGKSALVNALSLSLPTTGSDEPSAAEAMVPFYIDTPGLDIPFTPGAGAWEKAIGADIIVLTHDLRQGALTDPEMAFLRSLKERFPDLRQRMIVALTHGDKAAYQILERLSAIHRNLGILFLSSCHAIPAESYPDPAGSRVPVLLLELNRIQALQQQLQLVIRSYQGGLSGMRSAGIKALLDRLDSWIAGAIKTRKKRITLGEAELNQTFSLWQRDLQRLGETLRFRINDVRQR
ncbi:GTPase domain-containing protein [Sodalis sp. dw_96]|uniref:GTPase domain-containing protein n=1 Tax=Sodalis sp. dw_96 TaxID=2719794 RepID=UPI001BD4F8EC|nr:GTPase domain-containing protein [Sodalis sp. dw_96]